MSSTITMLNKYLGEPLPDEYVVYVIMKSHLNSTHYNTTVQDKWNLDQLMAQFNVSKKKKD